MSYAGALQGLVLFLIGVVTWLIVFRNLAKRPLVAPCFGIGFDLCAVLIGRALTAAR